MKETISFTAQPNDVREKSPWYLLGIKLGDYKIHKDMVVAAV
jgi:hypothetical protein